MTSDIQSKRDAVVEAAKAFRRASDRLVGEEVEEVDERFGSHDSRIALYMAVNVLEQAERPSRVEVIRNALAEGCGRAEFVEAALTAWESKVTPQECKEIGGHVWKLVQQSWTGTFAPDEATEIRECQRCGRRERREWLRVPSE